MRSDDYDYYSTRARDERERASTSTRQAVIDIHLKLAEKYEALAEAAMAAPTVSAGWDNSPES